VDVGMMIWEIEASRLGLDVEVITVTVHDVVVDVDIKVVVRIITINWSPESPHNVNEASSNANNQSYFTIYP
jgi:hypothetical protein